MKAVVQESYGAPHELLELREVGEPVAGDDEVLVRIHATSVNPADWHLLRGDPRIARLQMGLRAPKHIVLGSDVAGTVDAVGRNVSLFQPGDEVFGNSFARGFGAFAERAAVAEDLLVQKPGNLSFEQAAAVPLAALTALQGLRDHGQVERGQRVLVIGASGGVGTFAVQLARLLGAEVTGVCSERNVDLVRSLGAHDVIDYTRDDFTVGARRFDVIFQLAGTASPSELRRILSPKGTLVLSSGESDGHWVGPLGRVLNAVALSPFVSQRLVSFTMTPGRDDLRFLKERLEAGELEPVIDRTYPLAEVPEAIRYLEQGHARGKVIVTVTGE
jgi:NADPH:quinone reductase-like Zn-dependent oxidoreductase